MLIKPQIEPQRTEIGNMVLVNKKELKKALKDAKRAYKWRKDELSVANELSSVINSIERWSK